MKSIIKMQKTLEVLFFISLVLLLSCSIDLNDKPKIDHQIIGSWQWLESFGGFAGQHLTPESQGYTRTIVFDPDHDYREYRGEEEYVVSEFDIANKPAWGDDSSIEDILIIEDQIIEQIINIENNDSLHLAEICMDCFEHYYLRVESN